MRDDSVYRRDAAQCIQGCQFVLSDFRHLPTLQVLYLATAHLCYMPDISVAATGPSRIGLLYCNIISPHSRDILFFIEGAHSQIAFGNQALGSLGVVHSSSCLYYRFFNYYDFSNNIVLYLSLIHI